MKPINQQELIVSLITDDLIHTKLVHGLMQLGLAAEPYFLQLSDTIFELLPFANHTQQEEVYKQYLQLCKQANALDVATNHQQFKELAQHIYEILLKYQANAHQLHL